MINSININFCLFQGCLGEGGLGPPSFKKIVCKGGPGRALKIGQVHNCKHLDFRAEVLKLGGVKGLQGGPLPLLLLHLVD